MFKAEIFKEKLKGLLTVSNFKDYMAHLLAWEDIPKIN